MAVLETDFIIDALRDQRNARAKLEELLEAGEPLAVTPVSATEVLKGAHRRGGVHLDASIQFLRAFAVLEFDLASAVAAGRIAAEAEADGAAMGVADFMTAGIVMRHGERLLTRDAAFARVRGLRVERY